MDVILSLKIRKTANCHWPCQIRMNRYSIKVVRNPLTIHQLCVVHNRELRCIYDLFLNWIDKINNNTFVFLLYILWVIRKTSTMLSIVWNCWEREREKTAHLMYKYGYCYGSFVYCWYLHYKNTNKPNWICVLK